MHPVVPATRLTLLAVTLAATLATGLACSHKRPLREGLAIPAPDATRLTPATLPEVDESKRPPKWLDHPREKGDDLYGVGVVKGRGNRDVDLYRVQAEAERSVAEWLRGRGMRVEAPRGLVEPLDVELRAVFFDKITHNRRSDTWYCLARLDRDAEADHLKERTKVENDRLNRARKRLDADRPGERVGAALAILFHLDRRAEYRAQYRALTGDDLDVPRKLRVDRLEGAARDLLAAYGVRLNTSGAPVDGLTEAVTAALERLSLRPGSTGKGEVSVRIHRREQWAGNHPFVYLDGEMRVDLEGPTGPARMVPLHAKGSGIDLPEAEVQAARKLGQIAAQSVIGTARRIAE